MMNTEHISLTDGAKNVVGVFLQATLAERLFGERWYPSITDFLVKLAQETQITLYQVAGVMAALSPRNRWFRNMKDAEQFCTLYSNFGAERALALKVATFGNNKRKALQILECKEPTKEAIEGILRGAKTTAFFRCFIGYTDHPCIDGHAYSVWIGERIPVTAIPTITPKRQQLIEEDYRLAARWVDVSPRELQAITWLTWHRIYNIKGGPDYGY